MKIYNGGIILLFLKPVMNISIITNSGVMWHNEPHLMSNAVHSLTSENQLM